MLNRINVNPANYISRIVALRSSGQLDGFINLNYILTHIFYCTLTVNKEGM
jgi:hypothetical protein